MDFCYYGNFFILLFYSGRSASSAEGLREGVFVNFWVGQGAEGEVSVLRGGHSYLLKEWEAVLTVHAMKLIKQS